MLKTKVNPIRAKLDILYEHTEALVETAEKNGKKEIADQLRKKLSEIEKLSEKEHTLIDEDKYDNICSAHEENDN